jgi:hypothetical protein
MDALTPFKLQGAHLAFSCCATQHSRFEARRLPVWLVHEYRCLIIRLLTQQTASWCVKSVQANVWLSTGSSCNALRRVTLIYINCEMVRDAVAPLNVQAHAAAATAVG